MRRVAALAAVVAAALAGCGVPLDGGAHPVDPASVPPALTAPVSTAVEPGPASMPISVWYVRGNRLVPTFRSVAYPATAAAAVEALVAGPGASAGKDVRTLWRRPEQIAATTTRAGSVLVDLAPEVREISPAEQVLAIAQLVLTLTEVPGVGTVEFQIDGKRVSVPRGDGSQTDAPVSRDDYRALTGSG